MIQDLIKIMLSLQAIKSFCKENRNCNDCIFYINRNCMFCEGHYDAKTPDNWNLDECVNELKILFNSDKEDQENDSH